MQPHDREIAMSRGNRADPGPLLRPLSSRSRHLATVSYRGRSRDIFLERGSSFEVEDYSFVSNRDIGSLEENDIVKLRMI